jgi:hypothetical protein
MTKTPEFTLVIEYRPVAEIKDEDQRAIGTPFVG